MATDYLLTEFDALKNYLLHADYQLDTNAIERANRAISLNRRSSLFFGSHEGVDRSALLFSPACSCRLQKINTFEYFADILNRMAKIPPNASYDVLRELLPDRWQKLPTEVAIESSAQAITFLLHLVFCMYEYFFCRLLMSCWTYGFIPSIKYFSGHFRSSTCKHIVNGFL